MGQPRSLSVHIPVKDLSMNRTLSVKWALTLLIPFLVYFIPVPLDVVNPKMPLFLAFTVWAVVAWITEILPSVVVATVLTFLYALFVTTPQNAFGAWLTFLPWIPSTACNITTTPGGHHATNRQPISSRP